MVHLLWFIPLVVGLVSMWWVQLQGLAVLVALICGLIGLYQLVMGTRGLPLARSHQERDTRDVQRNLPPGPADY
jgi:hypothetical protein